MSRTLIPSRETSEQGFSTAWILGIAILILLVGVVFSEFGSVLVRRQELVTAADRAANAGATAINEELLISSDGARVELYDGNPPTSPPTETAIDRCYAVIVKESLKSNSKIDSARSGCLLDATNQVITATVVGDLDLGMVSGWLGPTTKTFTIKSRARPSCSDSATSSGAC